MEKAQEWWLKAANSHDPIAQYNLAFFCHKKMGQQQTMKWLLKAANNGHAEAQKFLALKIYLGVNIDRNKVDGLKWMLLGAEKTIKWLWIVKLHIEMMKWFMSRKQFIQSYELMRQWKAHKLNDDNP